MSNLLGFIRCSSLMIRLYVVLFCVCVCVCVFVCVVLKFVVHVMFSNVSHEVQVCDSSSSWTATSIVNIDAIEEV